MKSGRLHSTATTSRGTIHLVDSILPEGILTVCGKSADKWVLHKDHRSFVSLMDLPNFCKKCRGCSLK